MRIIKLNADANLKALARQLREAALVLEHSVSPVAGEVEINAHDAITEAFQAFRNATDVVEVPVHGPETRPEVAAPTEIELHLGPGALGTKAVSIHEAGGRYTQCRGYNETRFVHLPNTVEGRELANELIRKFPGRDRLSNRDVTCVIFRGGSERANVAYVKNNSADRVEKALERYYAANEAIISGRL